MHKQLVFLIALAFAVLIATGAYAASNGKPMLSTKPAETPEVKIEEETQTVSAPASDTETGPLPQYTVTPGTETYRGFVVDNVLHAGDLGDIHYSLLVPESYDATYPAALFVTLPGEPGLYYQGAGENLRVEEFAFTAQDYDENMIIAAVQPNDWEQTSADQVIALTEHLLAAYDIDSTRVYLEGYSYGGETLSLVMGTKPELYSAALQCASQWNGDPEVLAKARVPIRIALGDDDEFYTVKDARRFADELRTLYRAQGLSEREINRLVVLDIKDSSYFEGRDGGQHGSGSPLMANDPELMGWLFAQ